MLRGLGGRIALTAMAVGLLATAIVAGSIILYGRDLFMHMMAGEVVHSSYAQVAFDQAVIRVGLEAGAGAVIAAVVLGLLLARRISRPLERVGAAARRVAEGDYGARVPRAGANEIRSVADSFNQMAEGLATQERQRAELVANFAHELRTPLTNLRGYLEAMRDGVMSPSVEIFESLREEVERLERLSRSLDSLSGLGGGEPADPAEIDLAASVRAAAELARPGFARSGLWLEVEVPRGRLPALAVPDHLNQVLANLLQNALRYTPAGGTVTVSACAERDSVLVTVSNTGTEVPAADLPHLFERFYRVEKSRDRARGGAGIGLAIVKQLVEQAGGRVGADSGAGSTRFWFRLPTG